MGWTIEIDPRAQRDIARLDKGMQRKVVRYLETRVATATNPESFGKALAGPLAGLWRSGLKTTESSAESNASGSPS